MSKRLPEKRDKAIRAIVGKAEREHSMDRAEEVTNDGHDAFAAAHGQTTIAERPQR